MGLLDWLTEGVGSSMGGSAMPPGIYPGGGDIPAMNRSERLITSDRPSPLPAPDSRNNPAIAMAVGGGMGGLDMSGQPKIGAPNPPQAAYQSPISPSLVSQGVPSLDPMTAGGMVPLPMPRPPGADASIPPAATPTSGSGMPPGLPLDITGGGASTAPPANSGWQDSLSRALGLNPNQASQISGSLGAGLKSVGDNAHKPGLAAFASSAGSAMEGGKAADDKTLDNQNKYLQRAIEAQKAGDQAKYQVNYLKYLTENAKDKLELEKKKAADGGKASVMNSPEQLYLRAIGATNQDAGIKISAANVKEVQKQFGADSKEAKAAMAEHEKRIASVRDGHLQTLGVDPKKIKGLESKPGFSDQNPVKDFPKDPQAAQKAFDALPEGAYFVNPKDGRLLIKKGAGGGGAANPAQPSGVPPIPTAPGQTPDTSDED